MTVQVLFSGIFALLILLLPDLVVFNRARSLSLKVPRKPYTPSNNRQADEIDVVVPVQVPEDEVFALEWTRVFNQSFPGSGGKLFISSNGRWHGNADFSSCRLEVRHTEGNGSKINNLENAILATDGGVIAIFDADSRPVKAVDFDLISHHLAESDCVQGSNITASQSLNSFGLFCEYESLVSACMSETFSSGEEGTSQFRGTNAYFRSETIKGLRFRVDTALEDIDATIRLLCRGGKIRFEPRLLAIEAAPMDRWELLKQRSRWSFGWGHLCRMHLFTVLASKKLTRHQKIRIAGYLVWVTFFLPVAFTAILILPWSTGWLLVAVLIKFATSELLVRKHAKSSRMSSVFEASSRSRNVSLFHRIWFSAQLVLIDLLKSLSIFGFALGTGSNWPATRKTF
ncbi:glycosyltransferase family 2 protein [Tateyamaria sp. syn59]|uniref:glycosyltransferase n=1 Tax=Tateyamaria sp. syn59 TaxID=2576942 RepID=UPI0011BF1C8D|nr:glycosyltransferase family 2 protein [Tateyamaria sp. syn59]